MFGKLFLRKRFTIAALGFVAVIAAAAMLRPAVQSALYSQPTAAAKKKLPIYCVDTCGEKKVAVSFDAAWGAGRKRINTVFVIYRSMLL